MAIPQPETLYFDSDETNGFPNSSLPVLVYRHVIDICDAEKRADTFEAMFKRHDWPPAWRYGMFTFDHFHSTAHEALGVFRGQALARLGGPNGSELMLYAGDALVLPAGVGHACVEAGDDFCMVGASPSGQEPEIERGDPATLAAAQARVASVALPKHAPVGGPLTALWGQAS